MINIRKILWRYRTVACVVAAALLMTACTVLPAPGKAAVNPLPEGWHDGAFMEIFVRAYRDTNSDGIGDLRGVTQSLDYLQALGIKGIWLMPITKSADHDHGYATADYRAIEPDYGTLADFDELIREAHQRGIGVIMDYVINHSAAEHAFFVDARSNPKSPYRDWFVWADDAPRGWEIWDKNPWYYTAGEPWLFKGHPKDLPAPPAGAKGFYFGTFGPHMPDFNMRNPAVVKYHEDALKFWLDRGLDGYRLDATPHLIENSAKDWNDQPESRALTYRFKQRIKSYGKRYVVCEATAEPREWAREDICGASFAFGLQYVIVKAAKGDAKAAMEVAEYYNKMLPGMATFLHNHDFFAGARLADQLGAGSQAYRLAAATYLLGPGTPFIYYGEEIGMAGTPCANGEKKCGDDPLRGPMSWTPDAKNAGFTKSTPFRPVSANVATNNAQQQLANPQGLPAFYRTMLTLRNTRPSIARGTLEQMKAVGQTLSFQRALAGERTLVVINYGGSEARMNIAGLPANSRLAAVWPAQTASAVANANGQAQLTIAPRSLMVLAVHP